MTTRACGMDFGVCGDCALRVGYLENLFLKLAPIKAGPRQREGRTFWDCAMNVDGYSRILEHPPFLPELWRTVVGSSAACASNRRHPPRRSLSPPRRPLTRSPRLPLRASAPACASSPARCRYSWSMVRSCAELPGRTEGTGQLASGAPCTVRTPLYTYQPRPCCTYRVPWHRRRQAAGAGADGDAHRLLGELGDTARRRLARRPHLQRLRQHDHHSTAQRHGHGKAALA